MVAALGGLGQTSFEPGRHIVTRADNAVATYDGSIPGYPATSPGGGDQLNARRVPALDYLTDKQETVAADAGVTIDPSYTAALNGFSAELTSVQAARLVADKNVVAVAPDD